MTKTFIIAEVGVNHNGSLDIAKRLVDAAIKAGADAVKFQSFKTANLASKYGQKAEYQKKTTGEAGSQLEMLRKLELSENAQRELFSYCRRKKIIFISSPFDLGSVGFLSKLGLNIFKIPSGEITNLPYLRKMGSLDKKIIMSTGMADLGEIEDALNTLIISGTTREDITVLHCNTEYPTPIKDVNLSAMLTIRDALKVNVGYSDHTLGIEIPVAAVALGAAVIEKHLTLDKIMIGPDHQASLEPKEFEIMVKSIRNIEKALGKGIKAPSPSEAKNKAIARKSIVAAKNIKKKEVFTDKNITVKRPGTGISPMEWDKIIGRRAIKNFNMDDLIEI